ncbi:hypothetical protein BVX93_00830 [bacterium B13(2017)]|nr:hypothetical protein BVX93_00830 [bacterium B13(2017)]
MLKTTNRRNNYKYLLLINIKVIVFALIFAIIIRLFIFSPFQINGDKVLVNRLVYILKKPVKGDIMVFKSLEKFHSNRIIGLPGEKISLNNNQTVAVPKDSYFFSGDIAMVSKDKILGKAFIIYWPPKRWRVIK